MKIKYKITKLFLIKEYTKRKKSAILIAKKLKCSCWTIYYWLKKYGIKTRTQSEIMKGRKGKKAPRYIDGRTIKKYYCKCGRRMNRQAKKCSKCYHNSRKGKNYPKCIDCDKEINYQSTRCKECGYIYIKKSGKLKKNNNGMFGKKRPEMSKRMKGNQFGKFSYGKGNYYKGNYMRSSWEIAYAKYLDKQGIKWLYESKAFDLGNSTYRPDFYLPKKKLWIEIKGWWRDDAKKKFRKFKKKYPKIKIKILKRKQLITLGVLSK